MTNTIGVCTWLFAVASVLAVTLPHNLGPAPADGDDWEIYTVDNAGWRYSVSSMALDSKGYPHFSYYERGNHDLRYAAWDGYEWNIEVVDFEGEVGQFSSIKLDSNDRPHISYYDNTIYALKYAVWNGKAWDIDIVERFDSDGGTTIIALDSRDQPHVCYHVHVLHGDGTSHYDIRYASWNGTGWDIDIVHQGWHGLAMALDSLDRPHITFWYGEGFDQLRHAWLNGGVWNVDVVDPAYDVGYYTSIAIDGNDSPRVAYADNANDKLMYAKWNGTGWELEVISPVKSYGLSLTLDENDRPHLAYSTSGALHYAVMNQTGWNFEIVDSEFSMYNTPSLVLDDDAYPHTGYMGDVFVRYATKADIQGPPSIDLNIDPDTLNIDSMGKWITAYLMTKGAKPQDVDPTSLLLNDVLRPEWWDIQDNTTLMAKFNRSAVERILPVAIEVDIKITGQWKEGVAFELHDTIRVIDIGSHKEGPWSVSSLRHVLCHNIEGDSSTLLSGRVFNNNWTRPKVTERLL